MFSRKKKTTEEEEAGLDWKRLVPNDPLILDEIIRQGEARLQAQLQSALASDARAGVMASIQGAAAAALFVAATGKDFEPRLQLSAFVAAFVFTFGAFFAACALRPVAFGWVGSKPSDWLDDIGEGIGLLAAKAQTAVWIEKGLNHNGGAIRLNCRLTNAAIICLVAAPLSAGVLLLWP
jgi:hypothetical protein